MRRSKRQSNIGGRYNLVARSTTPYPLPGKAVGTVVELVVCFHVEMKDTQCWLYLSKAAEDEPVQPLVRVGSTPSGPIMLKMDRGRVARD